ncbi:MAG: transporter substrate-binding domain-containing protein [Candidatus Riflebacteria bacterium]|nr:transporter substrate-binding domain-containing protein [Candidatus Riflebacteria bacterium]
MFAVLAKSATEESPTKILDSNKFISTLSEQERTWLHEHPVIRVFQDSGWPPVEFINEHGQHSGISEEYLRLIEQLLEVKFELAPNQDWLEAFAKMKRWEIDMTMSVAETPQRAEFWAFTKPYLNIPIVIATQMDVTYIADLHELIGKRVAVVKNYAIDEWLSRDFPGIQRVHVKATVEGLEMLQRGEVFAYIDNLLIIGYYQAKMLAAAVKIAGQTPYVNAQCIAVRKDWAPLAGILQKALESISEKQRNDIYRKWLPIRYEHGFNYTLFWKILSIFVLVILGMVFWNRKLAREIGFRKQAEMEIAESRAKLKAALESMIDAVFISDVNGAIIEFNEAFATFHRFKSKNECRENLSNYSSILEVYLPDGTLAPLNMRAIPKALRGETGINIEYTLRRKDSGETWVGIYNFSPILDKNNAIVGAVVVGRDITEYKQAEEEKKKLEAQLFQAQKMESIGQLAGGVAHDFNNMLSVIVGYVELAMEKVAMENSLHADLEEILAAANRSADITRQLLAFARKQTIAPKVLDLNKTIENMLKMLRRLIGEDIDLVWLPGVEVCPVKIDPVQVDQILANLCVNARDAISNVGKITIATENIEFDENYCADHAVVPGEYVLIAVSDNGKGIAPENMNKIFEPFFTTKRLNNGTGLGLATVYGIVRQNNGFIDVYSEPENGTTIRIYLPRHTGETVEALKENTLAIPLGRGETILLVEDDSSILILAKKMLKGLGYSVIATSSASNAIELAEKHPGEINLLVTDVIMPEMNGQELAENLRKMYPNLLVLFMSGYTADIIANRGILEANVCFIPKPFSKQNLALKVREVLDGAKREL